MDPCAACRQATPRITVYRGIPFAAPPVGKLRWCAPQPAANWAGVRDCLEFAPISMQGTPGENPDELYAREWHVDPQIPMDEDCLYLNIWTPAVTGDEKLPVFRVVFGGGFQCGYTAEMEFDGERLARRGMVVVTVNYRVNVFGFFAHPELTAEAPDAPANFGLLDQQAGPVLGEAQHCGLRRRSGSHHHRRPVRRRRQRDGAAQQPGKRSLLPERDCAERHFLPPV